MAIDQNLFDLFPISELVSPKDNHKVYMNRYWIVYEGSVLRYKKTKAWQCNSLKELVEQVLETNSIYEGCEIKYFKYLYVPES
ncbi:hypothetical protein GAP32_349 [Cronobacter phage vB_CsaM_GAP32]|uniref:Uncharacterized protein n=1 Tax=Cronobacter phage vB_CsaM_GAP32 TaxID=1141136 RepID=K4FB64_9CAUD|nr:hypothetical protein GAP32_349 [Cronobacter phage vB_CsaM_GAP32]AFC21799.1 hypothetical protein GAP32_349 [Cronobacter phage vB_CsaM_GAP32]